MASTFATSPLADNNVKLTYDTLLHVISVSLYASEAVKLMTTCQFLYHEGAKIALKRPVAVRNTKQLTSFLKFLRAENLSRCRHLRQLELWACYPEPDLAQELVETIPLLGNIRHLRLYSVEDILEPYPALLSAFAGLTSLRHIELYGAGGVACELLSTLRAPLITASIDFLGDSDERIFDHLDFDEWAKYHPTRLLANFAPTLEELQCIAWYTTTEPVFPGTVYPNMRRLSIELHDFPLRMDAFARAFPNLTDLRVRTEYHGGDIAHADLEGIQASRDTNLSAWQQLGGTWRNGLEHFSGCLVDLYAVGLACPIRRVTIVDALPDGPSTDMLATVLRAARPVHLKLQGVAGAMLGDSERGLIAMLRDGSASGLLNLALWVNFGAADREKDLRPIIDDFVSTLVRLPLRSLDLRFDTQGLDPTPEPDLMETLMCRQRGRPEPPAPTPAPLTPAERSLRTLRTDMDAIVGRLESIPSLEAALVMLPSSRGGGDSDDYTRKVTKGTVGLVGDEQWEDWLPGKNQSVW
ncbi:hypothetical protein V8D89_015650 [Ganoderma adspersum]